MDNKLLEIKNKLGNTPIIDLGDDIYGKLESKNPAGSIKDRAAFYMIYEALQSGKLSTKGAVVEATSGNTGIGLAYIAKELGIKCIIVMPDSMSMQRREMIKKYGAELVLTPASGGMASAVEKANEIVSANKGYFMANQFGNVASIHAHMETTAPELFNQLPDCKYVVAGLGSGGTVMGFIEYVKANKIDCDIITVEPASSPLLTKKIAGPHKIQGIGANFVPALVDQNKLGSIIDIKDEDAIAAVKEIHNKTGNKVGISSGAAYVAAKELRNSVKGKIVVIFPDGGDRYGEELYK